jgi:hypothetical protein
MTHLAARSPVIRQTLLHWAYELSAADFQEWKAARSSKSKASKASKK